MHHAPAQQASIASSLVSDILIKSEKQLVECGVAQQG
jgi:hypothetical protein